MPEFPSEFNNDGLPADDTPAEKIVPLSDYRLIRDPFDDTLLVDLDAMDTYKAIIEEWSSHAKPDLVAQELAMTTTPNQLVVHYPRLILYHGSGAHEPTFEEEADCAVFGDGFYASPDPRPAFGKALSRAKDRVKFDGVIQGTPTLPSVHQFELHNIKLANMRDPDALSKLMASYPHFLEICAGGMPDDGDIPIIEEIDTLLKDPDPLALQKVLQTTAPFFREFIMAQGYDGIIIEKIDYDSNDSTTTVVLAIPPTMVAPTRQATFTNPYILDTVVIDSMMPPCEDYGPEEH